MNRVTHWGVVLSAVMLSVIVGCKSPQTRGKIDDDIAPVDKYEVKVIADVTEAVSNADPYPVAGVGLVTGLNGTGSVARTSGWRTQLERELHKRGIKNTKPLLESKETSLVLVSAMIPAGAHKGDKFDVEIYLPPGSETTSLRDGVLEECWLVDHEMVASLGPTTGMERAGLGLSRGKASGPLVVEMGDAGENEKAVRARIWGGGVSMLDRTFTLNLNSNNSQARVAAQTAERINERFRAPAIGAMGGSSAKTQDRTTVVIVVPTQYRHNLPRYLRVVRMIPFREPKVMEKDAKPMTQAEVSEMMARYRQQLEADLLDPARTVTAAMRLEALGQDSIPVLKRAMSSPNTLVRFCAAESLAYLNCPTCAEELTRIVADQPGLRAYALTALASMDGGPSISRLQDLLAHPVPEVRYGAFRALNSFEEEVDSVKGELLHQSFWLHRTVPDSSPLVHVSGSRRAEVVLFGEDVQFKPGFSLLAGNFVAASAPDDTKCTVSHGVGPNRQYVSCSLKVEDVLRTMARLGAQYGDVVEMLRQANSINGMTAELEIDALPQAPSVEQLTKAGLDSKRRAELAKLGKVPDLDDRTDEEIFNVRSDLGSTPGLFDTASGGRRFQTDIYRDEEAAFNDNSRRR